MTQTNLGVAYLQQGDTTSALAWAERALAIDPGYAKARALRARARSTEAAEGN